MFAKTAYVLDAPRLLKAQSIAASSPTGGGASGALVAAVLVRLGIADAVKPKIKYAAGGPGGLVGTLVAKGEAEIGLQQVSELMAAGGVEIVGPLPAVLETATQFSAGISGIASKSRSVVSKVAFQFSAKAASNLSTCESALPRRFTS